jgi:hypothetical protein
MTNTQENTVKNAIRATLLTLITAGILSAAVAPKTVVPVSPQASPMPGCPDGGDKCWRR